MGGGSGGGRFQGTRGSPITVPQGKMYRDGVHFNKHGRDMGFRTKREYAAAARDFAIKYQTHPDAKVYTANWSGRGWTGKTPQRVISYDGKTVVLDSVTGQVITFYKGTEHRGLIDITPIR